MSFTELRLSAARVWSCPICFPVSAVGLPPCLPRARAAASPACVGSVNEIPLKFSQGTHQVEGQLSTTSPGIQPLLQALELDTTHREARECVNEVAERRERPSRSSRETNERVSAPCESKRFRQAWPIGGAPRCGVSEDPLATAALRASSCMLRV
jgi:hypothetical protein